MSSAPVPLFDDTRYPGQGMAARAQDEVPHLSPWSRMMRGQATGKRSVINYNAATDAAQASAVNILELRGNDQDACQIQVTLVSPYAIVNDEIPIDIQNATGERDNANITPTDALTWAPIIAILKWGTGGTFAFAEVDFINGTTINVPASSIDVFAAVPADAINQPGTSGLYVASAFVTPGYPKPGNAQRTVFLGTLDPSEESDIFAIPRFAREITIVGADDTVGIPQVTVCYVRCWADAAGTINVGNFIVNGNQPISFRAPNGAMYFTVVSGTGIAMRFSAVFGLAI